MNFLDHLRQRREAASQRTSGTPGPKDPEQMSSEEREKEIKRLRWEKEKAEIKAIVLGRQYLGESSTSTTPRRPSPFGRSGATRRPFK